MLCLSVVPVGTQIGAPTGQSSAVLSVPVLTAGVESPSCLPTEYPLFTYSEVLSPAVFGITPESITHVYAWGFGAILGSFLLGYGVSLALGLVRKV